MLEKGTMYKIESISDFLSIVQDHATTYQNKQKKYYSNDNSLPQGPEWYKYNPNFWYRGHADFEWELQPKVERSDFVNSAKNASTTNNDYEYTILHQFLVRSPYLLPENLNLTEKYFLAQHHGLPTRLLDWSTNPLVALFFAVSACEDSCGSIYILHARSDYDYAEGEDIIYQNDQIITERIKDICQNKHSRNKHPQYPLRVIPNTQHGRILSQSSRFTFHHNSSFRIEENSNKNLIKFKIPSGSVKKTIMKELSGININWSTLFPDLDHLVKDIKWQTNTL